MILFATALADYNVLYKKCFIFKFNPKWLSLSIASFVRAIILT